MAQRPSSPRSQLSSLLLGKLGVPEDSLDAVMAEAQEKLTASDAENKLHNRKLYLVRWHTVRRWNARSEWGRARAFASAQRPLRLAGNRSRRDARLLQAPGAWRDAGRFAHLRARPAF
jgi:hypothetical protein